jgi:UDP-perosamine 4-acetyltransferase
MSTPEGHDVAMRRRLLTVIGLGAGGHAKVVLETLEAMDGHHVVGLLDPRRELWQTQFHGVEIIGGDELLERQYDAGVSHVFIGLGGASDTRPRRRLYDLAVSHGFDIVAAVHPSAVVSPSARLGRGPTVLPNAVVGADVLIGENVIVNSGAVVEHDCRIGDHVHIASGARLSGGVRVDDGAHVGVGASVIGGVNIGAGAVVGAGAAVIRDVPAESVVVGVPARVLRHVEAER